MEISTKLKSAFRFLGYYQIIGGVIGIVLNIYGFFTQLPVFGLVIIIPFLFFSLNCFSIYCGTECLKMEKSSLVKSAYNQILQILGFSMFGIIFNFVAGAYINFNFDLTNILSFNFTAGFSNFGLYYNQDTETIKISLNLVALGLLFFIDKLIASTKRGEEDHLNNS